MKLAQAVKIGAWLLIGLNLLMALGSIWVFMRMTPAIEVIIGRNVISLKACEEMLAALAVITETPEAHEALVTSFANTLTHAQGNITEKDEPAALAEISQTYALAFDGDPTARAKCVAAIIRLSRINRAAMIMADKNARQVGSAGAWGIVFMAVSVFFAGMLFKRSLSRNLVRPIEEIHTVITAHRNGDVMRRCVGSDLPRDVKILFNDINEFLDKTRPSVATDNYLLG